jgi:subtilisin family serine protease
VALSTLAAAATLSVLPLGSTASAAPDGPDASGLAPVIGAARDTAIEGRYVVVLEEDSSAKSATSAEETALDAGGVVKDSFDTALTGFTAELPSKAVEALREDPAVAFIEADQRVSISGSQVRAPWGLDRIDQRPRRLDGRYRFARTGKGVTAYVIDTGVRARHRELRGRVAPGFTAVKDGRGSNDCNGHGTHVAGIIGGRTYGVAKRVTVRPVRVLRCSGVGSNSGVIAGMDWIVRHHKAGPAVANMSLGGPPSRAMDLAVQRMVDDGVLVTVAAGNEGMDACEYSPGRTPSVLTVGAIQRSGARPWFSNWGSCVDLFAPGARITSAWFASNRATNTLDGTSMATPHVAGAAALYLQTHRQATPEQVKAVLLDGATTGKVSARAGSPNRLLFSRVDAAPPNNLFDNPGFEGGADGAWGTNVVDVINSYVDEGSYDGAWKAWLGGTGTRHDDSLEQRVAIPSGAKARLSFYLRINTNERTRKARDRMWVIVDDGQPRTLARFSNRTYGLGMVRHSYDLSRYAGRTVTIRFLAREDLGGETNFIIDQVGLSTRG